MGKTKVLVLLCIIVAFAVVGFSISNWNDKTTVADYINNGGPTNTVSYGNPNWTGETDATPVWSAGTNMPAPTRYHGGGVTYTRNDTSWLYCFGGDADGSGGVSGVTSIYNITTNTWSTGPVMPATNVMYTTAGRVGSTAFIIGGIGLGGAFTSEINEIKRYNLATNTWMSNAANYPVTVADAKTCGYQDSVLYVVGGISNGTSTATNQVNIYSVSTNTWRPCTVLPAPRSGGAMTISGDTIIYVGGGPAYGAGTNVVYRGVISQSDRSSITWTTGANFPGANNHRLDAAPWGCQGIVVSPGSASGFGTSTAVYRYTANTWVALPNTSTATSAAFVGSSVRTGNIWKLVVASGLVLTPPYSIPQVQILTDTLCPSPSVSACSVPELFYYKFENNVGSTTPNTALTPVGTNPTPVTAHTFSGLGMYDSSILGSSGTTGVINTGWAPNLGNGSWSIGMWLSNLPHQSVLGTSPMYLFGDVNTTAFRCFWAGAGSGPSDTAILLRKTGQPDLRLVLPNPYARSYYVHFVYDAGTSLLKGYRNGVEVASVTWTAPNVTGTGPFQIMGYNNTAAPLTPGTRMDEFRFYNRALTPAFITGSWNLAELPGCLTGISVANNEIPKVFSLSQNYPNPFNPTTNIKFSIPQNGLVKLVVFDVLGREVATLVNEVKPAGNYVADFDASALASGVYFYSITSGDFTQTKKMLLVK